MQHDRPAGLFARKPVATLLEQAENHPLHRYLGRGQLLSLGIGAIIGAGLFSLTGIAAGDNAGPAVTLSFVVAAIGCGFAGMCYSELASMLPVAGSAYTFAYATMGELVAWIIGWDLVLEYAVGAAVVAVSWSRYVAALLQSWGLHLPEALANSPFDTPSGIVNLPAVAVIVAISLLLMRGITESAWVNSVIVVIKVAVVLAVIGVGAFYVKPSNWVPFIPPNTGQFGQFGFSGIMRGAGVIFFAYIGFDAVSTAAQESRAPERDMPFGIIGSLAVCAVLYVAFGLVLTGLVNYRALHNDAHPVVTAIMRTPFPVLQQAVTLGIICGFTTVILVMLLGQSRVFYAMAADGLLPGLFARVHPRWRTPWLSNLVFMVATGALAGLTPIQVLGHMTSIGTLLAFVIVCAGLVVLRRLAPDAARGYRVPAAPLVAAGGIVVCLAMMLSLGTETWLRLIIWLLLGLAVFALYGRRHSHLARMRG